MIPTIPKHCPTCGGGFFRVARDGEPNHKAVVCMECGASSAFAAAPAASYADEQARLANILRTAR